MQVISHRGYWKDPGERNSLTAFRRAFESGFGAELDVRDYETSLVVAHDVPDGSSLPFSDVLTLYQSTGCNVPLAINIKSCGLASMLRNALDECAISNYFVFDLAVPDALAYIKRSIPTFTRQSEYESAPSFYPDATGVWIDGFQSDWVDEETLSEHLQHQKKICIVSPELHGRPHEPTWARFGTWSTFGDPRISLCTDYPQAATELFKNMITKA